MHYDFDTPVNRRGTYAMKWEVEESELPMWVADMDFKTAPQIVEALSRRAEHGIFGYSIVPDAWYEAYCSWWEKRYQFELEKEWLVFCTGVVPAVASAVRKFTTVGENVLIQSPVYNIFYNSILNNGRRVMESPLLYEEGEYRVDFDDLESKLSDPQTTMMIVCNPHNPIGKIWDRDTLAQIGELCKRHQVIVLSDEIHCDLTEPGTQYIPFASVSDACRQNSITCIAPTKTFNLAGLQTAAVMIPNEMLRHKMSRALNTDEVAEPNVFAVTAVLSAYTEGGAWLDELRSYLYRSRCFVKEYLERELPSVKLTASEATYLLWLDCRNLPGCDGRRAERLREKTGLYLSNGVVFGKGGSGFLRMNIACPRTILKDGLERLKTGVDSEPAIAEMGYQNEIE